MTRIIINGTSDGALINCVHLWNLKYVDNASYFLRDPQNSCLECDMVTEHQLSTPMEAESVSKLYLRGWLLVWVVQVMQVMCDEFQENKHTSL